MKSKLFVSLALVLMFALPVLASQTTVTGILTDSMCTKKHMIPGKPNADCVRDCIRHGAKYVVVGGGKVVELKGNQEQFSVLAGKKVRVRGEAKGKTFSVTSIEVTH